MGFQTSIGVLEPITWVRGTIACPHSFMAWFLLKSFTISLMSLTAICTMGNSSQRLSLEMKKVQGIVASESGDPGSRPRPGSHLALALSTRLCSLDSFCSHTRKGWDVSYRTSAIFTLQNSNPLHITVGRLSWQEVHSFSYGAHEMEVMFYGICL